MAAHFGLDIGSTSIKIVKSDGKKISAISVISNASGKTWRRCLMPRRLPWSIRSRKCEGWPVFMIKRWSLPFRSLWFFPDHEISHYVFARTATRDQVELDQSFLPQMKLKQSWRCWRNLIKFRRWKKFRSMLWRANSGVGCLVQLYSFWAWNERLENEIPALIRAFLPC